MYAKLKMLMTVRSVRNRVIIQWTQPEISHEILRFDLIRKKASVPDTVSDGICVYSGTDLTYTDEDIKSSQVYYYRLFVVINDGTHSDDFLMDDHCVVKSIGFRVGTTSYADKVYQSMPDQVVADDESQDKNRPLYRFLQSIMEPMEKLRTISDSIIDQIDIDTCDEAFLPYHAQWMGVSYNRNFGVDVNRQFLKAWKEAEPYVGTEQGLRYLLQKVFKTNVEITPDYTRKVMSIHLVMDESNTYIMRYVGKIHEIIKNYLSFRVNYEFAFRYYSTAEVPVFAGAEVFDQRLYIRAMPSGLDSNNAEAYLSASGTGQNEYSVFEYQWNPDGSIRLVYVGNEVRIHTNEPYDGPYQYDE